jgi:hypothetical protein
MTEKIRKQEPNWKRWIPESIEPVPTGHSAECEDSDKNVCICGKSRNGAKP